MRSPLHKKPFPPRIERSAGALPRPQQTFKFGILADFSSLKRFSFKKQFSKPYILKQSDVIVRNFASHSANLQLNFQTKKYNRGVQIPGAMSPGLLNFGR
jgi:hypothetical protein